MDEQSARLKAANAVKEGVANRRELGAGVEMGLDEKALAKQLEREGFGHTIVWQDGPNTYYSEHTHEMETAHIVLNGEMSLTMDGRTATYRVGERCDVPAGAVHSAKMGPQGCRYLIGER